MRHSAARQCTVAVSTFEYTDDPAMGVHIGQPARLVSESVVEANGDFAAVPRHRLIFMFASIEPATRRRKGGGEWTDA